MESSSPRPRPSLYSVLSRAPTAQATCKFLLGNFMLQSCITLTTFFPRLSSTLLVEHFCTSNRTYFDRTGCFTIRGDLTADKQLWYEYTRESQHVRSHKHCLLREICFFVILLINRDVRFATLTLDWEFCNTNDNDKQMLHIGLYPDNWRTIPTRQLWTSWNLNDDRSLALSWWLSLWTVNADANIIITLYSYEFPIVSRRDAGSTLTNSKSFVITVINVIIVPKRKMLKYYNYNKSLMQFFVIWKKNVQSSLNYSPVFWSVLYIARASSTVAPSNAESIKTVEGKRRAISTVFTKIRL